MKKYNCQMISKGCVEGEILFSKDPVCFYTVKPETGEVIEKNHDIKGQVLEGKILVIPSGKGSSVVQADGLYKLSCTGKGPIGIIVEHADPVLVSGVIIMEIPMVHKVEKNFYTEVKSGMKIKLDATGGIVTLLDS